MKVLKYPGKLVVEVFAREGDPREGTLAGRWVKPRPVAHEAAERLASDITARCDALGIGWPRNLVAALRDDA